METLTEPMLKTTEQAFNELDLKTRELVHVSKLLNEEFYKLRNNLEVRTDRMRLDWAFDYLNQYQKEGARLVSEMGKVISNAADEARKGK